MATLPIIDLNALATSEALAAQLMAVGQDPGFFYLIGHDIPLEIRTTLFNLSKNFFENCSDDHKRRFTSTSGEPGYSESGKEKLSGLGRGDLKESYHFKTLSRFPEIELPDVLDQGRAQLRAFSTECERVGQLLLRGFSDGLNVTDIMACHHFSESDNPHSSRYDFCPARTPGSRTASACYITHPSLSE